MKKEEQEKKQAKKRKPIQIGSYLVVETEEGLRVSLITPGIMTIHPFQDSLDIRNPK